MRAVERRLRRPPRRALTALELVLSTVVLLTVGWVFFAWAFRACLAAIHEAYCLIAWPYL